MLLALQVPNDGAREAARLVALLLVHGVHALVWAAAAGLLARLVAPRAVVVAWLWKLALLGPLLTTLLTRVAHPADESVRHGAAALATSTPEVALRWSLDASALLVSLAVLASAACGLGLARFTLRACRLARQVRGRRPMRAGRLHARLARLCELAGQRGVLLSDLPALHGPMVLGRREICVPAGVLDAFPEDEVDAMLAHELAHLEHRDGLWFLGLALLEAFLQVQPLIRWVALRCRHAAELAADDRAAALTGRPGALARALTRMAALDVTGEASLAPALSSSAALRVRVARLLRREGARAAPRAAWLPVLALSLLALLVPRMRAELVSGSSEAPAREDEQAVYEALDLLRGRIWALDAELAQARHASVGDAARVLELEQDLRHARAQAQWTAARLAGADSAPRTRP